MDRWHLFLSHSHLHLIMTYIFDSFGKGLFISLILNTLTNDVYGHGAAVDHMAAYDRS